MIFELSKKVLLYWRFTAAVLFAAVFSTLWILPYLSFTLKLIIALVIVSVFLVWWAIFLPLRFKAECIAVQNGKIYCRKGVLIKREHVYPNAKLVYVQTVRLPLASCFGLYTLVLRGVGHSLVLPAMTLQQKCTFLKEVGTLE